MEIVFDACKNDYFIDGEIKKNNSQQQSVESPPPPMSCDWIRYIQCWALKSDMVKGNYKGMKVASNLLKLCIKL